MRCIQRHRERRTFRSASEVMLRISPERLNPICVAIADTSHKESLYGLGSFMVNRWMLFVQPSRFLPFLTVFLLAGAVLATPANKAALERHYDKFLARELARCTTCHLP